MDDAGCTRCGRPPLPATVLARGRDMAAGFAERHARAPWLRSASLLSYTLRSRRRGFLDDPARPFTRAALRFLFELAWLGGPAGISPLAETVIHDEIEPRSKALARAVREFLRLHRGQLQKMDCGFDDWLGRLES